MRRGQAMLEYVVALAAVLFLVGIMGYLVTAAVEASDRTSRVVRSDSP